MPNNTKTDGILSQIAKVPAIPMIMQFFLLIWLIFNASQIRKTQTKASVMYCLYSVAYLINIECVPSHNTPERA